MVKLAEEDIKTKEVLSWKGLHVFHFPYSSCSQKLRIFMNLKNLEYESHLVDLMHNENLTEHYLGINPRGLVPVLVDNGDVHIESNDILNYLENKFPEPSLMAAGAEDEMAALLKLEDDLHLDLRALSFRFVFNPPGPPKSPDDLDVYANAGSGTVNGKKDPRVGIEIDFWKQIASEGITDKVARSAAAKFKRHFSELDEKLAYRPYILGDSISLADIAWFIYNNRLSLAGYPRERLHPNLDRWYNKLAAKPAFAKEVALPEPVAAMFDATRAQHAAEGKSLEAVAGL